MAVSLVGGNPGVPMSHTHQVTIRKRTVGCSFSLRVFPKVNQSVEQVDCYAQLSTNVVDLKLFNE
jgi:hypothetical protein